MRGERQVSESFKKQQRNTKTLALVTILTATTLLILLFPAAFSPTWNQTNPTDYEAKTGRAGNDFNHTKVTSGLELTADGNIMPDGELYIPDRWQPGGGLIGYWKLDTNVATVAGDSSGQGNNGTWTNGADSKQTQTAHGSSTKTQETLMTSMTKLIWEI